MRFIVEYFTSNGLKQIELHAQSYREVEELALHQEYGVLGIKCIRELRTFEERRIS
jgi:hypothetical protein